MELEQLFEEILRKEAPTHSEAYRAAQKVSDAIY
jgi:hypothetical protein